VFLQAADRSGKPLQLTKDLITYPRASSSDGKLLIGTEHEGLGRPYHTVVIPMENPERRDRLAPNSDNPDISPDRQWLAYQSSKTGRSEIYVRPFRAAGDEFQITTEGGTRPLFSRDGTELYYWTQSAGVVSIKAVRIVPGPPSSWSTPQTVVTGPYVSPSSDRHYDEWKGRFLMMKDAVADGSRPRHEIVMLLNWFEELKRRRPVK
jgi:Tol biopolymer transport system component